MEQSRKDQILEKLAQATGHKGVKAPELTDPEKTKKMDKASLERMRQRAHSPKADALAKAQGESARKGQKILRQIGNRTLALGAAGGAGLGLAGYGAYKLLKKDKKK